MNATMKGAVCGFALGVGVMFALGSSGKGSQPGRYQITGDANYLAMVDTATGQVWAGNFNQLGPGGPALEFKNCPQNNGDFFRVKSE